MLSDCCVRQAGGLTLVVRETIALLVLALSSQCCTMET
jgi:hypothetical protein